MRPARFAFHAFIPAAFAALVLAAGPGNARAADAERYRLDVSIAQQYDRFHSRAADSLGHSLSSGLHTAAAFDFRVVEVPMAGDEKPALHVSGRATASERTFGTAGIALGPGIPAEVVEAPVVEMGAGVALRVPMAIVDKGAGSAFVLGYEGGLVVAGGSGYDFMRLKRVTFGFERTKGFFDGSLVEMAYGRNETYGLDHASKRWATRFRIQGRLGPFGAPEAAVAGAPGGAATPPRPGTPVRVFVDLTVDTDGGPGPDGINVLAGLSLDAGGVLSRMMGAVY